MTERPCHTAHLPPRAARRVLVAVLDAPAERRDALLARVCPDVDQDWARQELEVAARYFTRRQYQTAGELAAGVVEAQQEAQQHRLTDA